MRCLAFLSTNYFKAGWRSDPSFPAYLSCGWARASNFFRSRQPVTCYEPHDERIASPCLRMIEGADAFGQRREAVPSCQ